MCGTSNKDHASGTITYGASHISQAVNAPKLNTVSEQIRGAEAGQTTQVGLDSMSISHARDAPKLNTVSEQVRGAEAGQATQIGLDSMSVSRARDAPKLDTATANVKTVNFCSGCGQKASGNFCSGCGAQLVHHNNY
jgi:hypothetical protein